MKEIALVILGLFSGAILAWFQFKYIWVNQRMVEPKLSDSGNRVNLGQDMKELDHTVWHDIKKKGRNLSRKLIKIL